MNLKKKLVCVRQIESALTKLTKQGWRVEKSATCVEDDKPFMVEIVVSYQPPSVMDEPL